MRGEREDRREGEKDRLNLALSQYERENLYLCLFCFLILSNIAMDRTVSVK